MKVNSFRVIAIIFLLALLVSLSGSLSARNPILRGGSPEFSTVSCPQGQVALASAPLWIKTYGGFYAGMSGDEYDALSAIQPSGDGGYVAVGMAELFFGSSSSSEAVALKVGPSGDVEWQVAYGGIIAGKYCKANAITVARDGGYYVVGTIDQDVQDVLVMKLGSNGSVLWTKAYGGTGAYVNNIGYSVAATNDGGCVIAAQSSAFGQLTVWIFRLDSLGRIVWQKAMGDPNSFAIPFSIQAVPKGGFIVTGYASYCTDESCNSSYERAFVIKLTGSGGREWHKSFAVNPLGDYDCLTTSVVCEPDGGYVIAGSTGISSEHSHPTYLLLFKLDHTGSRIWHKEYSFDPRYPSLTKTGDGGYLAAGYGGICKLNSSGAFQWGRMFNDPDLDFGGYGVSGVLQRGDGGFVMTASGSFDATLPLVMNLDSKGKVGSSCPLVRIIPTSGREKVVLVRASEAFGIQITAAQVRDLGPISSAGACTVKTKCIYYPAN